ncbi:Tn3 family transposase [Streptomyces mirabilis]|uniref:Tn3 family transposase n=1 Tax=Streptomyces mirabilis TaxID=68239 RepID=UPI0037188886
MEQLYPDRAAKQVAADGFPVTDDLLARLSPLQFDHINFLGRYAFFLPQKASRRPLREPLTGEQDDDGRQEGRPRDGRAARMVALRRPRPDGGGISWRPSSDRAPCAVRRFRG